MEYFGIEGLKSMKKLGLWLCLIGVSCSFVAADNLGRRGRINMPCGLGRTCELSSSFCCSQWSGICCPFGLTCCVSGGTTFCCNNQGIYLGIPATPRPSSSRNREIFPYSHRIV
uniref:Cysteine rich secreted protein n=1 Tax=Riptortus pedestris TaxID=329032 RepID=R4WKP1_RIPPE|nr:cysteine rich secreted protein [Riptortus pedestris]